MNNKLLKKSEITKFPAAGEGMSWFAIGPNVWGKGKTAQDAIKQARLNGRGKMTLHLVNDTAEVDSVNGALYYKTNTKGLQLNVGYFNCR